MARAPQNLPPYVDTVKRNGRINYRARIMVPKHLQAILGKNSLEKRLGSDRSKAIENCYAVIASFQKTIKEAQVRHDQDSKPLELDTITAVKAGKALHELLSRHFDQARSIYDVDADFIDQTTHAYTMYANRLRALAAGDLDDDAAEKTLGFAVEHLTTEKIIPQPGKGGRRELLQLLAPVALDAMAVTQSRDHGNLVDPAPQAPILNVPEEELKPASTLPKLSAEFEVWCAEKLKAKQNGQRGWTEKTAKEHRVWMELFIQTFGDKSIDEYTKANAREFRSIILKTPANWKDKKELGRIDNLAEAADMADKIGLPPMSNTNARKVLGFVAEFWPWAIPQFDEPIIDIFDGLKIQKDGQARDDRDPFSDAELRAIVNAPLYTGCKSVRYWRKPGKLVPRDTGQFWVPLISLYSGARAGEIIQLYFEDIKEEQGILYFDINDGGDDKRLKTRTSKRKIPVHPMLIELGFKDLLKSRKEEKAKRMFPDLGMGKDGYYSSVYSKSFGLFLKSIKIKRPKISFHSFRHNFEDACRNSGVPENIMNALQGHAENGMAGRYGSGFNLQSLNEAMQKIEYRNLDISHLLLK